MPVFNNVPCWQRPEWGSKMEFNLETGLLIQAVFELRERGLSGLQLLKTWVEWNIQSLGYRIFPMFEYRGLEVANCLLQRETSESEVKGRMHLVTDLPLGEIHMGVTIEPYSQANPRPMVSRDKQPFIF